MASLIARSADGTPISVERYGDGPALVVVSGALFDQAGWNGAVQLLSVGRTVYVLDRRGRGNSEDPPGYQPNREVEDVLAVLEAAGGPADLLGHSSGALLALQAAQRRPLGLRSLVLYEPPVFFGDDRMPADLPERLERLVEAGERDAAVVMLLREGPRAPETQIQGMRRGPAWAGFVALAHTTPYDARIQQEFELDPRRMERVRVPTLLLVGSESPARMRHGTDAVAACLPDARIRELSGERHVAMLSSPALFADAVDRFLLDPTS